MDRLIFIEGLPGTGKTTVSKWLARELSQSGTPVSFLLEGDPRIPCDFYETAGMARTEFDKICFSFPESASLLLSRGLFIGGYVFLRTADLPETLRDALGIYDMGNEQNKNITPGEYARRALAWLSHWVDSEQNRGVTTVIDSGFLQNPLNEMLFRGASDSEASAFIRDIADTVRPLWPFCVYLRRDSAAEAILFAKKAKGPEWSERIDALLSMPGYRNYFERRFRLENELLSSGIIPTVSCPVKDDDWSDAKALILRSIIGV